MTSLLNADSSAHPYSWARIGLALNGLHQESQAISTASDLAQLFSAELAFLYAPPDVSSMTPWIAEGYITGIQLNAFDTLRQQAIEQEKVARKSYDSSDYLRKSFSILTSPQWLDLGLKARLCDVMVFDDQASRGLGFLSEGFEQVLIEEQSAILVARTPLNGAKTAIIAWDGKAPSSRAARCAVPLLKHCELVVILNVESDDPVDVNLLAQYYAAHGIQAQCELRPRSHDIAQTVLECAKTHHADLIIAGAFGHSRLREFVFGGTTKALLAASKFNLFMAH